MFSLNSFHIYNDNATAELKIDGIGELKTKITITPDLLAEIKKQCYESAEKQLLNKFETKSEVFHVIDFNKKPLPPTLTESSFDAEETTQSIEQVQK